MIRVLLIIAAAIVLIPAAMIVILIAASAVFGICTICRDRPEQGNLDRERRARSEERRRLCL